MTNVTLRSGPRRFSLATALLFICTLSALAAWWGANQRTERAVREAMHLRLQLEQYQAELGQLSVIDPTKVHAIGLRMDPEDRLRWKWRVFLPQTRSWRLLLVDGPTSCDRDQINLQLQGNADSNRMTYVQLPAGEFVLEAAIVPRDADRQEFVLVCAINGQPSTELQLSDFNALAAFGLGFSVGPNDRSVWEPGEQALLLSRREAASSTATRTVAIWLWESPSSDPPNLQSHAVP